jgi:hypothetical protein
MHICVVLLTVALIVEPPCAYAQPQNQQAAPCFEIYQNTSSGPAGALYSTNAPDKVEHSLVQHH